VYREFESVIDDIYAYLEGTESKEGTLVLTILQLETWIISRFEELGISLPYITSDFFTANVDSLKAIQMSGLIIKCLHLGGNVGRCSNMIVYECGNTQKLAAVFHRLRTEGKYGEDDNVKLMTEMIKIYSILAPLVFGNESIPEKANMVSCMFTRSYSPDKKR
jgi:hypothetical protein